MRGVREELRLYTGARDTPGAMRRRRVGVRMVWLQAGASEHPGRSWDLGGRKAEGGGALLMHWRPGAF